MISREELSRASSDRSAEPSEEKDVQDDGEESVEDESVVEKDEEEKAEELPIERQLEVVDMNNEDMDMLEWLVRRTIPIPKQYYWETGNTDLPRKVKIWHNIVGSLSAATKWIERVGKPVADSTGLTSSRFDYVKDTMSVRQLEISNRNDAERRLRKEASRRALQAEEGEAENK